LFCYVILLSAILGFFGIFTYMGKPGRAHCGARIWLPGLSFAFIFSSIFVKAYRVWRIFDNKELKRIQITDIDLLTGAIFLMILEVLGLIIWSVRDPPHSSIVFGNPSRLICTSFDYGVYTMGQQGWKFINFFVGCYLAWRTRNVHSRFNESKDIAFAIYNYFFISLLVVPIVAFLPQGPIWFVFQSLGDLIILYAVLWVLFFKKLILLYRPDKLEEQDPHFTTQGGNSRLSQTTLLSRSVSGLSVLGSSSTTIITPAGGTDIDEYTNPIFWGMDPATPTTPTSPTASSAALLPPQNPEEADTNAFWSHPNLKFEVDRDIAEDPKVVDQEPQVVEQEEKVVEATSNVDPE